MSWNPTVKVIDLRHIADNLFAYFEVNQEEALAWANEGEGLKPIEKFYKSAKGRLGTIFPSLTLIKKEKANAIGDTLQGGFSLIFECVISGSDKEELLEKADRYDLAISSMISNISSAALCAKANNPMNATLNSLETEFEATAQDLKVRGMFYQVFQTRCTYKLTASAY